MNRLEKWLLNIILKNHIRKGEDPFNVIKQIYSAIDERCTDVFYKKRRPDLVDKIQSYAFEERKGKI
jgi:hypothetical protein